MWLVLLFVVLPVVELTLLVLIGRWVGIGPTVLIVVGTGLIGGAFARREGLRVLRRARDAWAHGRAPDEGLFGALLVLVGGILLVTPGVITDAIGLALLVPPTRRGVARAARRWFDRQVRRGKIIVFPGPDSGPGGGCPDVIDV